MGDLGRRLDVLQAAEEVRVLDDHGRRLRGHGLAEGVQVGDALGERRGLEPDGRALAVGLDDLAIERIHALRDHGRLSLGDGVGHQHGLGDRGGAVVERGVGHVHARQLRHHGLVLEDGAQRPLARLGLIRRVGGEEFATQDQMVDRARDRVIVGAPAQEAGEVIRVGVLRGQPAQVPDEIAFRHGRRNIQRTREPGLGGDAREKILDGAYPDGGEHLALLGRGVRDVAHGLSAPPRRRASRSRPRT